MKAEKDKKTGKWLIQYRYTDWQGKRRKSTKRGFATRRSSDLYHHQQLPPPPPTLRHVNDPNALHLLVSLARGHATEDFWKMYCADMETRLREHTMRTKKVYRGAENSPVFRE